jgi:hypothetical protein
MSGRTQWISNQIVIPGGGGETVQLSDLNCGHEQGLGMLAYLSLPSADIESNKNSTALIYSIFSCRILRFRQISFPVN